MQLGVYSIPSNEYGNVEASHFDWSNVPLNYVVEEGERFVITAQGAIFNNGPDVSRPYKWDYLKEDNGGIWRKSIYNGFRDDYNRAIVPTIEAPNSNSVEVTILEITLRDSLGNEESRKVTITSSPVAARPSANASASNTNPALGEQVSLDVVNTTTTNRRVKWTQLSGPEAQIDNRYSSFPTITIPEMAPELRRPIYTEDWHLNERNLLPSNLVNPKGIDHLFDMSYAGCYQMDAVDGQGQQTRGDIKAFGIDPVGRKMLFGGTTNFDPICEYQIPASFYTGDDYTQAPNISVTQDYLDIRNLFTEGEVIPNDHRVDGVLWHDNKWLVTTEDWYDGSGTRVDNLQVFTDSSIADGNHTGYWRVEGAAKVAGYMSKLPTDIATELGEEYMIGWASNWSIIGRYSVGPSFQTFNPDDVLTQDITVNRDISTTPYMQFSLQEPLELDDNVLRWEDQVGYVWNILSDCYYTFIVPNTRYLLCLGNNGGMEEGIGYKCLSEDTSASPAAGFLEIGGDKRNYYWVFDLDEILAAQNLYDPKPISYGNFPVPFCVDDTCHIGAVTFDDVNDQLHINLSNAGGDNGRSLTVVYNVTAKANVNDVPVITDDIVFEAQITDDNSFISKDTVTLSVDTSTVNIPPVANAGPNQVDIAIGETVLLDGSASTDSDGTIVSYLWEYLGQESVTLNNANSVIANFVMPPISEVFTFRLTVTDDVGGTSSDIVSISPVPFAIPVADAGPDQSGIEAGERVTLDGTSSTDSDGTIVNYFWLQTSGTAVGIFNNTSSIAQFDAPSLASPETLTFRLTVTDDVGYTDTDEVSIGVLLDNSAPVANAGPDQTDVPSGSFVTLDGTSSSDVDGNISTYLWEQLSGTPVTILNATSAQTGFTSPALVADETLVFRLTVTDSEGEQDSDTINIGVLGNDNISSTINVDYPKMLSVISTQIDIPDTPPVVIPPTLPPSSMQELKNIGSGFNRSLINDNFKVIEDELNNRVLKRNRAGESQNVMDQPLDMNSNRLLNLPPPQSMLEPARIQDIEELAGGVVNIDVTNIDNSTKVPVLNVQNLSESYLITEEDNNRLFRCINSGPIEIVVPYGLPSGIIVYFLQDSEHLITFRGATALESGEDADYDLLSPLGYHPYTRNSVVCVTTITSGTGSLAGDLA